MVEREGEFSYPIVFEKGFEGLPEALREVGLAGKKCMLVSDSNVAPLYLAAAKEKLGVAGCEVFTFVFPAGEENKNLAVVQDLYERSIEAGLDRGSFFAALGGGVTGDLTGFASATYLRGVDFIQLPTTLLSQVDSSVGGKTGVDFLSYKNMVGAFHQPRLVYMAMDTLKTLPAVQFASGMGEVLKTGLICDGVFFRETVTGRAAIQERDPVALTMLIRRCCEIKASVVAADPTEKGVRALLNLGHTIGHAIEKKMDFTLLHGQCVALGLIATAVVSKGRGLMTGEEVLEVEKACEAFSLPTRVPALGTLRLDPLEVLEATKKDKKMEKGRVKFILMRGIGDSFIDSSVSDEELLAGIRKVVG